MVGGPFVVAADERELHRHLERGLVGRLAGEAGEDGAEELLLEVVHHVVHVGQRRRDGLVAVGERVDREVGLHARLRAHPLDDPADPGRQLAGVEAAGRAGDVAHQAAGELDLVQDPQHGEHRPQVGGHGLLQREQLVHAVLDLEHPLLDLAVGVVDLVDDGEVGVEQGLGGGADLLAAS